MLADCPPVLARDVYFQAAVGAMANEMQRLQDTANAIRTALLPVSANDVTVLNGNAVVPMLSLLETLLGLPVAPVGVPVATRRASVLSRLQTRNSSAGSDWVALINAILGPGWSYVEG